MAKLKLKHIEKQISYLLSHFCVSTPIQTQIYSFGSIAEKVSVKRHVLNEVMNEQHTIHFFIHQHPLQSVMGYMRGYSKQRGLFHTDINPTK